MSVMQRLQSSDLVDSMRGLGAACDFNGPNLQRVGINAQVHLAPLPLIFGSVLLALPFPFAQELEARTVHTSESSAVALR